MSVTITLGNNLRIEVNSPSQAAEFVRELGVCLDTSRVTTGSLEHSSESAPASIILRKRDPVLSLTPIR